jgi:hypothetical protein
MGLSRGVAAALKRAGVSSLAAIRRLAGPEDLAARAGIPLDQAEALADHAALALLSEAVGVRTQLRTAGQRSIAAIARTPLPALTKQLAGQAPADVLAVQRRALALTAMTRHEFAGLVGGMANQWGGYRPGDVWGGVDPDILNPAVRGALDDLLSPPQPCIPCTAGCESLLSPSAYLLDLLDFLHDTFTSSVGTGLSLADLDERFLQDWAHLDLSCGAVEMPVRQARIAIEVLERLILGRRASWTRDQLYGQMASLSANGTPAAQPDVLVQMFDAYLREVGTTRDEVAAAVTVGGQTLADLADRLGLSPTAVSQSLHRAPGQIGIAAVEALPAMVRQALTAGIDAQADPTAYDAANLRVGTALDRVEGQFVTALRDNLVRLALDLDLSGLVDHATPQALGDYLHLDLAAGDCQRTTRVAQAILTIQSFVQAFRLEPVMN